MTTTPVPFAIVALAGLLRVSLKRSAGSGVALSMMGTTMFLTVWPGAKVSVPLVAV